MRFELDYFSNGTIDEIIATKESLTVIMSNITKDDLKESIFKQNNPIKYFSIVYIHNDKEIIKEYELVNFKLELYSIVINEKEKNSLTDLEFIKTTCLSQPFNTFKRVDVEYIL